MSIKSTKDIYNVLEKYLRAAATPGGGGPMTVTALMDIDEVRSAALNELTSDGKDVRAASVQLSNALGLMWRRELLIKYPAPRESNSFARYAYIWAADDIQPEREIPFVNIGKKGLTFAEIEGGVVLDFPKFTITIRSKE